MKLGTKIVRSCELVENIWTQIDDLGNSLSALTESALKDKKFHNARSAGSSKASYELSASGWSNTAYAISFPVMEKNRRNAVPTAWISYQISVFGGGLPPSKDESQETPGPVVHVSFWRNATDFDNPEMTVTFPPEWAEWEIKDDRLLFWESEKEGQYAQWTFSIRLIELNNEDALERSIIKPIQALLAKQEVGVALPADLPGLIFYSDVDQGDSGRTVMASKWNEAIHKPG